MSPDEPLHLELRPWKPGFGHTLCSPTGCRLLLTPHLASGLSRPSQGHLWCSFPVPSALFCLPFHVILPHVHLGGHCCVSEAQF